MNNLRAGEDYCGYCHVAYDDRGKCICNGFGVLNSDTIGQKSQQIEENFDLMQRGFGISQRHPDGNRIHSSTSRYERRKGV